MYLVGGVLSCDGDICVDDLAYLAHVAVAGLCGVMDAVLLKAGWLIMVKNFRSGKLNIFLFWAVTAQSTASKMPEREETSAASATPLLEKRRELAEVELALANQNEEFQAKMEVLQKRREELNKKEEELKHSIKKFDKFLKENDCKRIRAKNKIASETELVIQKEKDIVRFNSELVALIDEREELKKKVEKYAIYPKYLEKVTKISNEFQDIRMVNARFETLFITHDVLFHNYQENQETIKIIKSDLNNFIKEKNNDAMKYHNSLAALQSRLDEAKAKTVKWESVWIHIQSTAAKRTLVLGMTKMAIFNLYMLASKGGKGFDTPVEDTDAQLKAIQQYILELRDIIHDLKKNEIS
ncbi:coiled-coil domain-containing protein 42 homolog [Heptranchias perlo]|uniref:coiled-coil domain-containing protein 42 homolog n=1 Tax=Heptranchias perlo TaxID=212740 RepID=UPI00355A6A24